VFLASNGAISWQSRKQSLIAMSTQGRVHRLLGGIVNYSYVHTDENVADILTKAMGLW
jgi:hypothetical protein